MAGLLASRDTRVLLVKGNLIQALPPDDHGRARVAYLTPPEPLPEGVGLYLGSSGGLDYVGLVVDGGDLEGPSQDVDWVSLREVGGHLGERDVAVVASATALAVWHGEARFCPSCGAPTRVVHAGWVRRCTAEAKELFPRMDPAVIVAVTDHADRLLLARAQHFGPGRYSVLAGFVDAGESLEAAVRREVGEEVGLELGRVSYLGSQSWPFPRSLMCAFEAQARGTDLTLDTEELAEAHWFTRAEFAAAIADGSVHVAPRSAIARSQIERWYGRALDLP
jgi:NAD+ diphosphatase